jgi:cell division septum initiation protein DivIVA
MAMQPENESIPAQQPGSWQPTTGDHTVAEASGDQSAPAEDLSRRAMRLRDSEEEIGRLILRVREVTDVAVKDANDEARRIVDQAKAEAARIINAAEIEGRERRDAALPVAVIHQMQATLEIYDRVNSELGHELRKLWDGLDAELKTRPEPPAQVSLSADNGQA